MNQKSLSRHLALSLLLIVSAQGALAQVGPRQPLPQPQGQFPELPQFPQQPQPQQPAQPVFGTPPQPQPGVGNQQGSNQPVTVTGNGNVITINAPTYNLQNGGANYGYESMMSWCNGVIADLERTIARAGEFESSDQVSNAIATYERTLTRINDPYNGAGPIVGTAISRGLELATIVRGNAQGNATLALLHFYRRYFQFLYNTATMIDRDYYVARKWCRGNCGNEYDARDFESRFIGYIRGQLLAPIDSLSQEFNGVVHPAGNPSVFYRAVELSVRNAFSDLYRVTFGTYYACAMRELAGVLDDLQSPIGNDFIQVQYAARGVKDAAAQIQPYSYCERVQVRGRGWSNGSASTPYAF